ncbi:ETC complex I subunit conserved region-domain-containing protein [Phellopilus nigrolimitatus]|nr:ETC complex I subunit conserved region-domain-containing protein [Phellopilus nigrolimitatus]
MSLLRAVQRGVAGRSAAPSASIIARSASTDVTKTQTETQASEITTTVPPKEAVTADVISGAPGELRHRTVRVFKPTRNTMQSGGAKGEKWRIDFDILQGGGRWENPLMGWAASADYMQGTRMSFRSKEDAIHFAEKQGALFRTRSKTCVGLTLSTLCLCAYRMGLLCVSTIIRAPYRRFI